MLAEVLLLILGENTRQRVLKLTLTSEKQTAARGVPYPTGILLHTIDFASDELDAWHAQRSNNAAGGCNSCELS
jgi:hypothetical protein